MRKAVFVLFVPILLSSCALTSVKETYSSGFTKKSLFNKKSAVFPILPTLFVKGDHLSITRAFSSAAKYNSPYQVSIAGYVAFVKEIMDKKLFDDMKDVISSYNKIGYFDKKKIRKIGKTLGYDYILVPIAEKDSYSVERKWNEGLSVWMNSFSFRVKVEMKILEVRTGKIVLSSEGSGSATTMTANSDLPSSNLITLYEDTFKKVVRKLFYPEDYKNILVKDKTMWGFGFGPTFTLNDLSVYKTSAYQEVYTTSANLYLKLMKINSSGFCYGGYLGLSVILTTPQENYSYSESLPNTVLGIPLYGLIQYRIGGLYFEGGIGAVYYAGYETIGFSYRIGFGYEIQISDEWSMDFGLFYRAFLGNVDGVGPFDTIAPVLAFNERF